MADSQGCSAWRWEKDEACVRYIAVFRKLWQVVGIDGLGRAKVLSSMIVGASQSDSSWNRVNMT
jgi:hypothetical protein